MGIAAIRRYALRGLVVLLCVAAWADLRPLAGSQDVLPIAVLDVSESVGGGLPGVPAGVRVRTHRVLVADGWQEVIEGAEAVRLPREATRLGAALRHVAATAPGVDVVLVTDARDTDGDAEAGAREVAAAGGRVFTAPPNEALADVGLEEARLVAAAPRARIRAVVTSSTSGRATVRLVREGAVVAAETISLAPGLVQAVELEDVAPPAEGATYQVVLVPLAGTPDDDPRDNRLAVGLRPERRVVLVWGVPEVLGTAGDLVVRAANEPDLAALRGADCVVLGNIPWAELGRSTTRDLERFVAGGGRLLLLGGPDAYASGGWLGTPLETRLSPLRVPRQAGTGLALVLALDRSGSTRGATLAHLKNAARRALQGITPGERLGVLPFAGRPDDALLEPGVLAAGDRPALDAGLAALDALEARGDTDLAAALRAAARFVHGIEAREHRVLLLTDGDPDNPPDPAALEAAADFLRERGVQFGAFVVGDAEAVARLRRHVAARPEDVQALDDAAALTAHLLHLVSELRGAHELIPVRPDRLVAVGAAPFDLRGFQPAGVQRLEVAVEDGARLLLEAAYDDLAPARVPFAAVRAVGAGEVAALAWGPALEAGGARAQAFGRLAPWIAQLASRSDRGLNATLEGEVLAVSWPEAAGRGAIVARTERGAADLVEMAPGLFRGPLPPRAETGVRVGHDGPGGADRPLRLPERPDPEHRGAGIDEVRLQAIAAAGGGRRLAPGEGPPPPVRAPRLPLAPWLLLAACILLVIDRLWAKPDGLPTDP